jgi:hypothetical protein
VYVNGVAWGQWSIINYGSESNGAVIVVGGLPSIATISICYLEPYSIDTDTPAYIMWDDFNRTVAEGTGYVVIGPASSGLHYSNSDSAYVPSSTNIKMENGYVRIIGPHYGYSGAQCSMELNPDYTPLSSGTIYGWEFRFRTSFIPWLNNALMAATGLDVEFACINAAGINMEISSVAGSITAHAWDPVSAPEPWSINKTDWVADTWYTVKGIFDGSDQRIKIWKDESESEPAGYVIAGEVSDTPWDLSIGVNATIDITITVDTTTYSSDYTIDIDYIKILTEAP